MNPKLFTAGTLIDERAVAKLAYIGQRVHDNRMLTLCTTRLFGHAHSNYWMRENFRLIDEYPDEYAAMNALARLHHELLRN